MKDKSMLWLLLLLPLVGILLFRGKTVSDRALRLAQAISVAEGFWAPGTIPAVRNNPGNITDGKGTVLTYASAAEGWSALYKLVTSALDGTSRFYGPDMTIEQMARTYTGEAAYMNWANNVSISLGVGVGTKISEV